MLSSLVTQFTIREINLTAMMADINRKRRDKRLVRSIDRVSRAIGNARGRCT